MERIRQDNIGVGNDSIGAGALSRDRNESIGVAISPCGRPCTSTFVPGQLRIDEEPTQENRHSSHLAAGPITPSGRERAEPYASQMRFILTSEREAGDLQDDEQDGPQAVADDEEARRSAWIAYYMANHQYAAARALRLGPPSPLRSS